MKKFICLTFALLIGMSAFVGCGGEKKKDPPKKDTPAAGATEGEKAK